MYLVNCHRNFMSPEYADELIKTLIEKKNAGDQA
jgi:hypothetical protein